MPNPLPIASPVVGEATNPDELTSCDCIDLVNTELDRKNLNTVLGIRIFWDGSPTRVQLQTFINEKKRGARAVPVLANYCPFCGKKYENAKEAATDAIY